MKSISIIGAGPAGCIAAISLARAGCAVRLIEQHRFPRDKVCGECLSALGIEVLERMGLQNEVRGLHPAVLRRARLFAGNGHGTELDLPRPMWGLSRLAMDARLLKIARESGVGLLQPARVEHREQVRDLLTNQIKPLRSDYILVADGRPAGTTSDLGLKAHFVNVDASADAIELFGVSGHYGGIAPIDGGRWNIAFSVPQSRIRSFRGDLDALFDAMVEENAELKRQMRLASRVSDWLTSPLPRSGVQRNWPDGVIPIGNAAAAIEPIGGEGMGLAMRSAQIAAEYAARAIRDNRGLDVAGLRREYRRLWGIRGWACRAAAMAVSSPWICRMILPLMSPGDPISAMALRAIGKAPATAA